MAKILVVEDEEDIRELLVNTLVYAGHDVTEAANGGAAVEQISRSRPDAMLLDVWMPVLDGYQVLRRIRQDPSTEALPVVFVTALPALEGERDALRLGVTHYVTKPWEAESLLSTLNVALREAEIDREPAGVRSKSWSGGSASSESRLRDAGGGGLLHTAGLLSPLEKIMGGGLPLGSLTLVEGAAATGKSVLCQHLAYGALDEGHRTAYLTSEQTARGLSKQMDSIGLAVSRYIFQDQLRLLPAQASAPGEDSTELLATLAQEIEDLPRQFEIVLLDSISNLAGYSSDQSVVGFFSSLRRLCSVGRTIVVAVHSYAFVAVHSYAFDDAVFSRLGALCDAHLRLRGGKVRSKLVRILEVVKVNDVELDRDNSISFEVEANAGMRIIPFSQVKA